MSSRHLPVAIRRPGNLTEAVWRAGAAAMGVPMNVEKCALGVIQQRGASVLNPSVVAIGAAESDFLARHVDRVRSKSDGGPRSVFAAGAITPTVLQRLQTTTSDGVFAESSKSLLLALAKTMKTSTNAKDCVFAVVRSTDSDGPSPCVTILKLDAVVEAAQMRRLANRGVSFKVLKELLPEPGKLQKALSWPDVRSSSDAILIDTNVTAAQYFEIAFNVEVSPSSSDTEERLLRALSNRVSADDFPRAMEVAAEREGPLNEVVKSLAEEFPELRPVVEAIAQETRPSGIVRKNKFASRQVTWRADGLVVRAQPFVAPRISKARRQDGRWALTIVTDDEPTLDSE